MKKLLSFTALLSFVLLASCGGGGGGDGDDPDVTGGEKISVTGTLSDTVSLKPGNVSGPRMAISDWSGATVKVINSSGTVLGSITANSDGSYTISDLTSGSNYVVRASTGNLVMKAFIADATADQSDVDVDPTSSAIVMVLASILEKDSLGDEGVDYSTEIGAIAAGPTVSSISSNSLITDVASAIESDIANSYDSTATTASVGSAGTAGDTTATSIAQVTPTVTTDVTGTWSGSLTTTGTLVSDSTQSYTEGPYDWSFTLTQSGTTVTGTGISEEEMAWTGSVSGSTLTLTTNTSGCSDTGTATLTFTVSGTTMTLTGASGEFCLGTSATGLAQDADANFTGISGTFTRTTTTTDSSLVGTWTSLTVNGISDADDRIITFNSNGTATSNCGEDAGGTSYTWSTSGGVLTMNGSGGCSGTTTCNSYSISGSTLSLSNCIDYNGDSEDSTWQRS